MSSLSLQLFAILKRENPGIIIFIERIFEIEFNLHKILLNYLLQDKENFQKFWYSY